MTADFNIIYYWLCITKRDIAFNILNAQVFRSICIAMSKSRSNYTSYNI